MGTKKIPISFNDEDQRNIKELVSLMGITNVYGDIPKALKFGIKLALSTIKNPSKVYGDLNTTELDLFFSSINLAEKKARNQKTIEKLQKDY